MHSLQANTRCITLMLTVGTYLTVKIKSAWDITMAVEEQFNTLNLNIPMLQ